MDKRLPHSIPSLINLSLYCSQAAQAIPVKNLSYCYYLVYHTYKVFFISRGLQSRVAYNWGQLKLFFL